jgi:NADH-quinone oxidoreductase subunit L
MFLALGVGAFAAGLFHVLTHAFFKALLFLGAGAVIHAMHEEQDIRNMGGLKAHLPITGRTFLIGAVAISGIPPLSGFFSKDEILGLAFSTGHTALWFVGFVGAGLTAFYMFRLYALTFEGTARWHAGKHPHEAPLTMTIPLMILALLSVVGGVVGIPASLGGNNAIEHFLEPVFGPANSKLGFHAPHGDAMEYVLMAASVALAACAIILAWRWYSTASPAPDALRSRLSGIHHFLLNKWFVDELYDAVVVNPTVKGSEKLLWKGVDIGLIDRVVNASGLVVRWFSRTVRVVQTGVAPNYVFVFVAGVVVLLAWILVR